MLPDRSKLLKILPTDEIVTRYRAIWGEGLSLDHVIAHAELEGELTDRLLLSKPETRGREFSECYGRLYKELPWLNGANSASANEGDLHTWGKLVGSGHKVLEIGSGHGFLIRHLAKQGNVCFGSEVTDERGEKLSSDADGVQWIQVDAVHLTRHVEPDSFDIVISDQVFEHLHPEDHLQHLRSVREVLKSGGRYILRAPHRSIGPTDVSKIFGFDQAVFMHLCEPNFILMNKLFFQAGFKNLAAISKKREFPIKSEWLLRYQMWIDFMEEKFIRSQASRRRLRRLGKYAFISDAVWVVGGK